MWSKCQIVLPICVKKQSIYFRCGIVVGNLEKKRTFKKQLKFKKMFQVFRF